MSEYLSETTWQTVAAHTDNVVKELAKTLSDLPLDEDKPRLLNIAARWHDWGKAHEKFQIKVDDGQELAWKDENQVQFRRDRPDEWRGHRDIAKAPGERQDRTGSIVDSGYWRSVGAAQATPITYLGADKRQYVVITATGGGFFNNAVTDDGILAFTLDGDSERE